MTPLQWVKKQLKAHDHEIYRQKDVFGNTHYLVDGVVPIRVHVSTMSLDQGRYQRWQWTIKSDQPQGVIVLVAIDDQGDAYAFVVPAAKLLGQTHVQVTSHPTKYKGWLSLYLDEWRVIDDEASKAKREVA